MISQNGNRKEGVDAGATPARASDSTRLGASGEKRRIYVVEDHLLLRHSSFWKSSFLLNDTAARPTQ